MRYFCILLFLITFSVSASAQNYKTGSWGVVTITLPGDSLHKWGGYSEFQVRTNTAAFTGFQYYEYKAGVSYDLDRNSTALIGTGRYTTYDYADLSEGPTVAETRLWEQFTNNQYLGRIKLEHRYRIEQRWLTNEYRNRFRYRLNVTVPVTRSKMLPKTFFIGVFDEVFFNNRSPNFERNRFFGSLGYQFNNSWSVQAGILNQNNVNLGPGNDKNNLMINLFYKILRQNHNSTSVTASTID